MALQAGPALDAVTDRIKAMFQSATSFDELRAMLSEGFDQVPQAALAKVLADGFIAANLAGRIDVEEERD